jgi:hypothetical protein
MQVLAPMPNARDSTTAMENPVPGPFAASRSEQVLSELIEEAEPCRLATILPERLHGAELEPGAPLGPIGDMPSAHQIARIGGNVKS